MTLDKRNIHARLSRPEGDTTMQAEAAQLHRQSTIPGAAAGALRAVESFLFRGAEATARRNAWSAVLEDRKRAKDRREAQHVMDALVSARTGRQDSL